ncbi:MAG: fibronectin type III domain-containing protein [Nitrospira sp.]|jgi:Fibronectin type III domain|nr:fibronectin type III domain-containing protein [Nitrospira sp.]
MLMRESLASLVTWKPIFSMTYLALFTLLLMPLAGCSGEGAGGPVISSLSTPTDATAGLDSDQVPQSEATDSDGEEDPVITMTSTPTGVTAHVTWVRPPDMNVAGYNVYYRKQASAEPSSEESNSEEPVSEESSSEEPSSCSTGQSQTVDGPSATIVGLEPNTRYLFAIRAFNENESESLCSNEIPAVTLPAQS